MDNDRSQNAGLALGIVTFLIWVLFPLYWNQLSHVDALEILSHRVLWTMPFCAFTMLFMGGFRQIRGLLTDFRTTSMLLMSTTLIAINWGTYIWSVNNGHVLDASLGYFLNPLINVAIGLTVFREKLRRLQWVALGLAALGVLYSTIAYGSFPVIGVVLATTFGGYGALRKKVQVDAVPGLFVETLLLMPFALGFLLWLAHGQGVSFLNVDPRTDILLILGGVVTGIPLLLYVGAARRLAMSTLGMLFYITPSGLFFLAVLFYGEPVSTSKMVTFAFIWVALALFTFDLRQSMRAPKVPPAGAPD